MFKHRRSKLSNRKIVDLKKWKEDHSKNSNQKSKEKKFKHYLGGLNFNELVNEADDITRELNTKSLDTNLAIKSKSILKEFIKRIGLSSPTLADSLRDIKRPTDQKIKNKFTTTTSNSDKC